VSWVNTFGATPSKQKRSPRGGAGTECLGLDRFHTRRSDTVLDKAARLLSVVQDVYDGGKDIIGPRWTLLDTMKVMRTARMWKG
jgi:hypothetical protein